MSFFSNLFHKNDLTSQQLIEFNFFYAFEFIPRVVKMYNNGQCGVEKLFDVPSIIKEHPNFSAYAEKLNLA